MRIVCQQFAGGRRARLGVGAQELTSDPLEPQLVRVAQTFVLLQAARHQADYDTARIFGRLEVTPIVDRAERALHDWRAVRARPNAVVFLAALLLQGRWNR